MRPAIGASFPAIRGGCSPVGAGASCGQDDVRQGTCTFVELWLEPDSELSHAAIHAGRGGVTQSDELMHRDTHEWLKGMVCKQPRVICYQFRRTRGPPCQRLVSLKSKTSRLRRRAHKQLFVQLWDAFETSADAQLRILW